MWTYNDKEHNQYTYYKKSCAGSDACDDVSGDAFPLPMILFAQRHKL